MEYNSVKKLLDRYFEGETSIQEEQQLRSYFASSDIDVTFEEYAPLFSAFKKASEITYDLPVVLPKKRSPLKYIASIAAVAIIALVLWVQNVNNNVGISSSYENEEVAILKTKQALGVMSQIITNSTTKLEVVSEFDKASSTLFKK